MAGQINISGSTEAVQLHGNDSYTVARDFTFPDESGELLIKDANDNVPGVGAINGGPLAGMRNVLINGDFRIWQRGDAIFHTPNSGESLFYTADRWGYQTGSTGRQIAMSKQTFALGQTDVPGEPKHFMRFEIVNGGTFGGWELFGQRIEDVRTFAGQQCTLSFYAQSISPFTLESINLKQWFGRPVSGGGTGSDAVFTNVASNVNLTGTWQKFEFTVTLPSIAGKTINETQEPPCLNLEFTQGGAGFTTPINIAQVQLEPGPVATMFEHRPIGTELALCQRYYCQGESFIKAAAPGGGTIGSKVFFPSTMRVVPTCSLNITLGSNGVLDYFETNGVVVAGTPNGVGDLKGNYTADAEL